MAMQDERLADEQEGGEQQPQTDHGVHPPELRRTKAGPQFEPRCHIETCDADHDKGCSRLPDETPLDCLEGLSRVLAQGLTPDGWKDNSRYHRNATNPDYYS
jgi:hypothetical protein